MSTWQEFKDKIAAIDLSNFKILEVSRTEKFTLVKATIHCPVYFAFYGNFIVCSGDYGEFVFDCTWQTNKQQIPESSGYLLGKLSRDCKKNLFSYSELKKNFPEAKRAFIEMHVDEAELTSEQIDELNDLWEDFEDALSWTDEYRIVGTVDQYAEQICDLLGIDNESEDWVNFYDAGDELNPQLIVNLAMLQKLRELNVLFDYEVKND